MNHEQSPTRYLAAHLILTLAGLAGTAGVFLPFAGMFSPRDGLIVYRDWPLAAPALLAPLATVGTIRWLISGSLSVPERIIAYFASASMMVLSLSFWFLLRGELVSLAWLMLSVQLLIFVLGIGALIRSWRVSESKQFVPVMSIQAVYVAHAAMCLIGFFGGWSVGAYFVLVATLAFAIQIVLVLVDGTRRPAAMPAQ